MLSLALAVPILWWWLPEHRRSVFGAAIDPTYRLQFAYGLLAMSMSATNLLCRAVPHGFLEYVHPTYAFMTLALLVGLGPRVIYMALSGRRGSHPMRA